MSTPQQQKQKAEPVCIDWPRMMGAAGPYPVEAFHFVREGLSHTAGRIHPNASQMSEADRHISGRQLCLGLRDFAILQYGMLAPVVFQHWNVHRTEDFGRIVFAMIDAGIMSKNANDTLEDFRAVFNFDEAFSTDQLQASIAVG